MLVVAAVLAGGASSIAARPTPAAAYPPGVPPVLTAVALGDRATATRLLGVPDRDAIVDGRYETPVRALLYHDVDGWEVLVSLCIPDEPDPAWACDADDPDAQPVRIVEATRAFADAIAADGVRASLDAALRAKAVVVERGCGVDDSRVQRSFPT